MRYLLSIRFSRKEINKEALLFVGQLVFLGHLPSKLTRANPSYHLRSRAIQVRAAISYPRIKHTRKVNFKTVQPMTLNRSHIFSFLLYLLNYNCLHKLTVKFLPMGLVSLRYDLNMFLLFLFIQQHFLIIQIICKLKTIGT